MANLAVLRNQGHSGSLWLTHLLNSELDVPAVSHEFNGFCPSHSPNANSSMMEFFGRRACACLAAAKRAHPCDVACSSLHSGSSKARNSTCDLVGWVTDPSGHTLQSLAALRGAGVNVKIAHLVRRNTVKQSLSRLKDKCDWPSPLAHNHLMHADAGSTAGKPTRSLVLLPPELLLRDAASLTHELEILRP